MAQVRDKADYDSASDKELRVILDEQVLINYTQISLKILQNSPESKIKRHSSFKLSPQQAARLGLRLQLG